MISAKDAGTSSTYASVTLNGRSLAVIHMRSEAPLDNLTTGVCTLISIREAVAGVRKTPPRLSHGLQLLHIVSISRDCKIH